LYYEFLRRGSENIPIFWGGAEAFNEAEKQQLMSQRLRSQFSSRTSWEVLKPIHERFKNKAWEPSILHWMTYLDLNFRLPELLLMRVDKMSMGTSLEGRVPFLDHKFVEFAMSIPSSLKTKNGDLKYLLKKAVRGIIPDELIDRKKQGFGVPVYEWLFDKLGHKIREDVKEFCNETNFLNFKEIESVTNNWRDHRSWYLLNLALWWKQFIKQEEPDVL